MRLLKGMLMVAALGLAGPVWAHGGHGHGRGHDGFHHDRHGHRHHSHWKHHRHHGHRYYDPYAYSGHYYPAYPRYGYAVAAPAPGIHVVVPNLYIPLR
jgi:hypothetical protein